MFLVIITKITLDISALNTNSQARILFAQASLKDMNSMLDDLP